MKVVIAEDERIIAMDGMEAAAILKERWGIPVVFTTAYDDDETRKRAGTIQNATFLVKPIDADAVRHALDGLTYVSSIF